MDAEEPDARTCLPACLEPTITSHAFPRADATGGLTLTERAAVSEPDDKVEVVRVTAGSSRRQIARTLRTHHRAGSDRDVAISTVCLYLPFYPQKNEAACWMLMFIFTFA